MATLVYAVVNSRIDYCNTVLAGAPRTVTDKLQRVLNADVCVVTGTWKFDRGLGARRTSMARRPRPGVFQAGSDSSQVSERLCTAVPVGTTGFRSPLLTIGGTCVPSTVNYLQYLATGLTLTAIGPFHTKLYFQLLAPQSGTLSRISSRTRPSVQTVSEVCLKRTCLLDTTALEVLDDNRAL